jgi:DNA repair protein RadD
LTGDLARFDRADLTERIADQIVAHGTERKSWLVFAVSVEHAEHLADALFRRGIDAHLLTGQTRSAERKSVVAAFKAGRRRCLVGVDVFSTGFDARGVDLIAIVRPIASSLTSPATLRGLGRSMRPTCARRANESPTTLHRAYVLAAIAPALWQHARRVVRYASRP